MLKKILHISRPISWVNTAIPFLVGFLAVSPHAGLSLVLVVGLVFFLFPYNLLLYGVNDIFDYASDLHNPRKQSIEGAVVAPDFHRKLWLCIGIVTVPFVVYFFMVGSGSSKLMLAFSLFMVITYSAAHLRFKEIPILDSITSSVHFWSPFAYGFLLAGGLFPASPASIAFFLWGMASHALGAIQDINYDRKGNINSISTVFGARTTIFISFILYFSASLIILIGYGLGALVPSLAILLYAVNAGLFLKIRDETSEQTRKAWATFLWLNYYVGFLITLYFISVSRLSGYGLQHQSLIQAIDGVLVLIGLMAVVLKGKKVAGFK